MSRLPRLPDGQTVKGNDYNLLAAAIDAGGFSNIQSQTTAQGITGQGLTQNFPPSSGSINPISGSSGTPKTPTGLTLNYGIDYYHQTHDGYIVVTWTPNPVSDNIARYDIYWHKGSDNNLHQLTVGGDVNLARINSVIPGQTYIFAIQAHDTAGRGSQFSMEESITISKDVDPPAIPTGVVATTIGAGIIVTWTEVGSEGISNDLKQYQVVVSTDGGVTYPTTYTVGPGNSFIYNPTVTTQATIFFKVATVDWTGNVSAFSSPVSAAVGGTIVGPLTINPGPLTVGSTALQSNAQIGTRTAGNDFEFGHNNPAGYGSTIGSEVNSGTPFLAFNAEAGTNVNTFRTRGIAGAVLESDLAGGFAFKTISNTNADNQTATTIASLTTAGLLTVSNGITVTAGDLTLTAGRLVFSAATSKIIPGGTSLSLRNHADSADNLILTDAGLGTMRNALSVPPSAGGTVAATSYGSVPVKIAETSLGAAAATITFSSIPQGFRHLQLRYQGNSDAAAQFNELAMTFNSDTGANYSYARNILGSGGLVHQDSSTTGQTSCRNFWVPAASSNVKVTEGIIEINNYSGTTFIKMAHITWPWIASGSNNFPLPPEWETTICLWNSTSAITRIDLATNVNGTGNFVAGSLFTLYGIP